MAELVPIRKTESVFDEVERMHARITRRAYDIFTSSGGIFGKDFEDWRQAEQELVWRPAIELTEKGDQFRLELAAAGVDPKNIDIEVTPEDILIQADVHHEHGETKGDVYACEFAHGNLFRSIHLPKKIEPEKVKAEFKNGLLTLNAPIAREAPTQKFPIEISA
jgi:HSP20 family molecular chaperone IbpA